MTDLPGNEEPVLSTLNKDGSRRKLHPKLSQGGFYRYRRAFGYFLIALFSAIPYLSMNGKPMILLDLPRREFTLFGTTFLPTETPLLMLLMLSIVVAVFLLTALFGRVWCGWACPQTIYMEFLYRPIERLIEGPPGLRRKIDAGGFSARRLLKYGVFLLVSIFLTHTFLGYFVGVSELFQWVQRSPFEHPAAFGVVLVVTAMMFLDFAWFREQTCIVACPYGRFQSVLLDRQSLIVGYDTARGEPRGKLKRGAEGAQGDCIDCNACVNTCPTGIDIRKGLQMECIGCTQCIDACDAIMDRVKKPRGLIRYTSQDELAGVGKRRLLRARTVAYPLLLVVAVSLLGISLGNRAATDVTVLRAAGPPFRVLPDGTVTNQLKIKISNRAASLKNFELALTAQDLKLVSPQNPLPVGSGKTETAIVFVMVPPGRFVGGELKVAFRVSVAGQEPVMKNYRLLGPGKGTAN